MWKLYVVISLFSSVSKFSFVQSYEMVMTRNSSFDNLIPLHTLYYITTFEKIGRLGCASKCLTRKSNCAAVLYNGQLQSCKLMKCQLTDRMVDFGSTSVGWEFWFQNNACPLNWVPFENHCYFFDNTTVNWNEAKVECENNDAHLVEIDSLTENTWATETFLPPWNTEECPKRSACCSCWIGGTDGDIEGVFTWNYHTNITYQNWYPRQPDNVNDADCAVICRDGNWVDQKCGNQKTFICETV